MASTTPRNSASNTTAKSEDTTAEETTTDENTKTIIRYTYVDNNDEEKTSDADPNDMRAIIILERHLGRSFQHGSTEDLAQLAYQKAGMPFGTTDEGFLEFVGSIVDLNPVEVPTRKNRPTPNA